MFGIGGESPVEIAYIQSFSIGKAVRQDWELIVAGAREFAPGIDVILGEDFFHKADVEFDLARSVVRLLEAKDCGDASLAYWTTEVTAEVAIEAVDEAAPQIIVPVKVNGHPMRALLDSGAPHSILTKRDAAAAGLTSSTPGAFLVGRSGGLGAQSVEMWVGPIDSFTIGNENIRDTTLHFGDLFKDVMVTETGTHVRRQIAGLPQMLLGIDFIRAHRVLVAHSQHKMYFSYVGGPTFQQPRPRPPQSVPPQSVPPPGASPPGAQGAKDREDSAPSGG